MTRRLPRQGVPEQQPKAKPVNPKRIDSWESLPIEEFERLRAENYAKGPSPTRRIGPERKRG